MLILMDLSMPVMGGIEATMAIREWEAQNNADPAIIFALSANVLIEQKQGCIDAGMDGFISKPVQKNDLLTSIQSTILEGGDTEEIISTTFDEAPDYQAYDQSLLPSLGREKMHDLVTKLKKEVEELTHTLAAANAYGPHSSAIHKLAGSSGMLGFIGLARQLQQTEQTCLSEAEPSDDDKKLATQALTFASAKLEKLGNELGTDKG